MKKFFAALAVLVMLSPAISFANTAELEAKHIQLLEQLIVILKAQLQQLLQNQAVQTGQTAPLVLGVSTTTNSNIVATTTVKKRSGGGGGGGGRSTPAPVPLTLDMAGSGNTFSLVANQPLSLENIIVSPLVFPSDIPLPASLKLYAIVNGGTVINIDLIKDAIEFTYSADLRARLLPGQTFTGEFQIVFPTSVSREYILYSVFISSNGVTRTINLTNAGDTALTILESNNDPDAATLLVDIDDNSDQYGLFNFKLQNEGGASSVLNNIIVASALDPEISLKKVVHSAKLVIGTTTSNGIINDSTINFSNLNRIILGNTTPEAQLLIVFKQQSGNYDFGQQISFSVNSSEILATREDDTTQNVVVSGEAGGASHTLAKVVPVISDINSEIDKNEAGNAGVISFEFNIASDSNEDIEFQLSDIVRTLTGGTAIATAVVSLSKVSGDATLSAGTWTIQDGDEATFVLDVTFITATNGDNGTYRVTLESILDVEVDETSPGMSLAF